MNVKGTSVFVKNLNLQMQATHQSLRGVPDHLRAAQAVSMLLGRDAGQKRREVRAPCVAESEFSVVSETPAKHGEVGPMEAAYSGTPKGRQEGGSP